MLSLYLLWKVTKEKTYLLSAWGAHLCSATTRMWLKWETKKSDMVIVHLSHQPLFHFPHIRASRLHCTEHISAGAKISLFYLPQQAGRIFHQNGPLSSHLRDTLRTTGSWSCSKWSDNPVACLRSIRNAYPLRQRSEPEDFTARPAHNKSKQVLGGGLPLRLMTPLQPCRSLWKYFKLEWYCCF